jgi:hypothetical protein
MTVKDMFDSIPDEHLATIYENTPMELYNMCLMLSLDLQLEKEDELQEPIVN